MTEWMIPPMEQPAYQEEPMEEPLEQTSYNMFNTDRMRHENEFTYITTRDDRLSHISALFDIPERIIWSYKNNRSILGRQHGIQEGKRIRIPCQFSYLLIEDERWGRQVGL